MNEEPEREDESTEARFRRVQEELRAMELSEMPDDEVNARLADIHARTPFGLPNVPESLDERLNSVETRANAAQRVHRETKNETQTRLADDAKATRGLGVGLAVAYALIGLPLVGALLGFLIQRLVAGPWIAAGAVIGFVGGLAFTVFLSGRESKRP